MTERKVDLHMHTTASDGTDTLEQRIEQAKDRGLDAIAITDHDRINSELEERSFRDEKLEVITGAEFKCEIEGVKIEILGYLLEPSGEEIQDLFDRLSENRVDRMKKMLENLNENEDAGITPEDILKRQSHTPGRPHIASELAEKGLVSSPSEAFEKLIGKHTENYESVDKLPAKEVIHAIHDNGGAAVMAHPGRSLTQENALEKVGKLVKADLDGLEVAYTYRQKLRMQSYDVNFTEVFASKLAENFDLITTGGSDCHGSKSDKYNIGKVKYSYSAVENLREAAVRYR
jgi:predicted metal-dependent phosphoesterase TrpH